jgi:hypothetical protein
MGTEKDWQAGSCVAAMRVSSKRSSIKDTTGPHTHKTLIPFKLLKAAGRWASLHYALLTANVESCKGLLGKESLLVDCVGSFIIAFTLIVISTNIGLERYAM